MSRRYDIYRQPLFSVIMSKDDFLAKYNLNKKYPVITMTTNFTLAGFAVKNKEFYEKDVKQLKTDRIGYGQRLAGQDLRSKEIFHQAFLRLIEDYPEANFIIKPHPSEDHTPYYDILEKSKQSCSGTCCSCSDRVHLGCS